MIIAQSPYFYKYEDVIIRYIVDTSVNDSPYFLIREEYYKSDSGYWYKSQQILLISSYCVGQYYPAIKSWSELVLDHIKNYSHASSSSLKHLSPSIDIIEKLNQLK